MSLSLDQVAQEALRLPATSRAELAERLVESLSNAEADEIQRAWAAEALRRRDETASGKVRAVDGQQVLSDVRRAVGR